MSVDEPRSIPRARHPRRPEIILAGVLCGLLALASAQVKAGDLDSYLDTIRADHGLPALAAAVVLDGEIIAAAAVGTRALGSDIAVTLDDRFHIGSNTKAMTATLAGMLVEDDRLRWDTTVGDVLGAIMPDISASLAAATLGELLSHSSGIPADNDEILDLYFNAEIFDHNLPALRRRLVDQWKHHDISVPEGSPFQYSNLGYVIAGMMIETVTGTAWEQLMHERIFAPLELATAGLGPQATYGLIDAAVGHRIEGDGSATPMLWGAAADVPQVIAPAGNAHMSISDYARWAGWNAGLGKRGPTLVSPETLATIQTAKVETPIRDNPPPGTPSTGSYGYGWGTVAFDWADGPLLTHNGSNSMNLARIIVDTRHDLAIVVTTNFPGPEANAAAGAVLEHLYTAYAR